MTGSMKRHYQISGNGVLCIDGNDVFILVEDKGTFNLASVLVDLNNRPVKFNFSYDEDYEECIEVNKETDEVI